MKIIVLDSTAKSIKAVLASSVATSNPDFVVAYADTSDNTFSELSSDGQLNGTTDVTLVSAPASGVKRAIKSITIYNRDTAAVTVSIKFDNGGTQRILQRVQLVSGETWHSDELTKLSPGGSDTQVQFNDLGTLAGSSNFTYNKTTSVLTLGANPVLTAGTANGVLYLNGSKVATSGSALTFDGSAFWVAATSVSTDSLNANGFRFGSGTFKQQFSAGFDFQQYYTAAGQSSPQAAIFADTAAWGVKITGTEQMRLTSTGLGIGLGGSSPAYKLTVEGTLAAKRGSANQYIAMSTSTGEGYLDTINTLSTDYIGFNFRQTNNAGTVTRATLDSSGNLGLGVTPSAATFKTLQIGNSNNVGSLSQDPSYNDFAFGSNCYLDTTWKYRKTGEGAALFRAYGYDGQFFWQRAGSGTAGNTISWTTAMTLDASGNLGVGTTSPSTYGKISSYISTPASGASSIYYGGSDGTKTFSLTQTGSAYSYAGIGANEFWLYLNGNYSALSIGSDSTVPIKFVSNGSERARITSGGYFKASNAGTYQDSTAAYHELRTNGSDWTALVSSANATAGNCFGVRILYSAASPNGTGNQFLTCVDWNGSAITTRAELRSNGGLANYQANDVNLSDRREKTNFAPAKDYLDTICAIPVQTFNYIDQSEDDPGLTLGVVAQDVQAVAPELVMESNWGTKDDPKMRLSIYQTDLQYALMKCIQELKADLDATKAELAALKA